MKTRPEVEALIAQELPEDEDDEEYEPTPDDVPVSSWELINYYNRQYWYWIGKIAETPKTHTMVNLSHELSIIGLCQK